jgi:hypothetical protein
MLSLQVIAENSRFPRQDLNGPLPGLVAKAIVMFTAELLQLSHETGMLATLNLDEGDKTAM